MHPLLPIIWSGPPADCSPSMLEAADAARLLGSSTSGGSEGGGTPAPVLSVACFSSQRVEDPYDVVCRHASRSCVAMGSR